jgi:hypothetical protein
MRWWLGILFCKSTEGQSKCRSTAFAEIEVIGLAQLRDTTGAASASSSTAVCCPRQAAKPKQQHHSMLASQGKAGYVH